MKTNAFLLFLCCLLSLPLAQAQPGNLVVPDTLPPGSRFPGDTLFQRDTLLLPGDVIRLSGDSLDAPVDYGARDSMILDNIEKKIYLYGEAFVNYTDVSLKAGYIIFDWENNLVQAEGFPDTSGVLKGFPEFKQADQVFNAKKMVYNFKTSKGVVFDVTTQQNDVVVHSSRTKFIRGEQVDTTKGNDILYSQDALFTTCTAEFPHFGIRSQKQKVIPNKLVVIGPSQLEIMDVPTPIWLPFGFFPINKGGRSTGLLFPNDYEYSTQWGFGLRDVGWFFPLGEHFNLSLRSDIYLRGTWGINAQSDYRKRYKYSGNLRLGFDSRKVEDLRTAAFNRTKSFSLNWSHRQESGAHPSARFGGSINIQTNNYQNRVFNDASNVLNAQLNSNMSFEKNWPGKPFNFSASFNHSQNRLNRSVTVNFPDFRFLTQSLYPFKRKERVGEERWYETIVLRYTGEARNRFESTDTTLFTQKTLDNALFGARHDAQLSTSFKVLKYFNLNPNVNYQEVWQWKSIDKNFDPAPVVRTDTIFRSDGTYTLRTDTLQYGTVSIDTLAGFKAYRTFNTGFSLNTRLFGTLNLGKWSPLKSIRHEIRPNISFNYSPDYLSPNLGYFEVVEKDSRDPNQTERYSIFDGGIFGGPPQAGTQMAIGYSLNNIFQAKVRTKRDTVDRKVKLIDNLILSGNYNFAADSLRWSQVNMSTTARFFKGVTTMGFSATFDPYLKDALGRRINVTAWSDRRQLLRFERASLRFNTDLTVERIRAIFQGKEPEVVEDLRQREQQRREQPKEDFLSLFENFSISHNIDFNWENGNDGQTRLRIGTNSINCRGNVQLTKKWAISVGNFGYDFTNKGLSYPSFGFVRDLHCWQMDFNWQPQRGTYSFNIRVKPGTLEFIKIPYQRNNADATRAFD